MKDRARVLLLLLLAGCAGGEPWSPDAGAAIARAAAAGRELVLFVALPGRELSDRMAREALPAAGVLAALRAGGYASATLDGFTHHDRYAQWIGAGEGMGIVVLGPDGLPNAARPGPQDPAELAAFLRFAAAQRDVLAAARAACRAAPDAPDAALRLGRCLLDLGCRRQALGWLQRADAGGEAEAARLLALLHGQDGRLAEARVALHRAGSAPEAGVADGYLCFKERRHAEAVARLEASLAQPLPPRERQRAMLFLGKALHECRRDAEARAVLTELATTAAGSTFAGAALHALSHFDAADHHHPAEPRWTPIR
jgi:hypothetical protein